jgi:hypothetical protein
MLGRDLALTLGLFSLSLGDALLPPRALLSLGRLPGTLRRCLPLLVRDRRGL